MSGFVFFECVYCYSWLFGIKIILVGGQCLGVFDMDQFVEMVYLIRVLQIVLIFGKFLYQIKFVVIQVVDFFCLDFQQIVQWVWEVVEIVEIGFIDDIGLVGGYQVVVVGDKCFCLIGKVVVYYI